MMELILFLKHVFAVIAFSFLVYTGFGFYFHDFDIHYWSPDGKAAYVSLLGITSMAGMVSYLENSEKRKLKNQNKNGE